jgi:hypothetical protein
MGIFDWVLDKVTPNLPQFDASPDHLFNSFLVPLNGGRSRFGFQLMCAKDRMQPSVGPT